MKNILVFLATTIFAIIILTNGGLAVDGAISGIELCTNIVIPSTFPFLVIACFVPLTGVSRYLMLPFKFVTSTILRLPDELAAALLMSFIGGYPAGIKSIATLHDYKLVSSETASRICYFAVNPSPAFVITAVGEVMFGSSSLGLMLYLSQVITTLILAFIFRPKHKNFCQKPTHAFSTSEAFVLAVSNASSSLITICGFIVFFSVITALLTHYTSIFSISRNIAIMLSGFLEVTTGCYLASQTGTGSILLIAFFLSFGGIAVAFQNIFICSNSKIKVKGYIFTRFLAGVLTSLIMHILLTLFPIALEVGNFLAPRAVYSSNSSFGIISLISMTLFLLTYSENINFKNLNKTS